jgi:flagellar basal-body rod protein FlgB
MVSPFSLTVDAVGLAMDIAHLRASTASHNIAYTDVPGATMRQASFGSAAGLLDSVAAGRDIDPARVTSARETELSEIDLPQQNLSEPSLDHEVTELAISSGRYQALAEALNRQFGLMSIALSGDQS